MATFALALCFDTSNHMIETFEIFSRKLPNQDGLAAGNPELAIEHLLGQIEGTFPCFAFEKSRTLLFLAKGDVYRSTFLMNIVSKSTFGIAIADCSQSSRFLYNSIFTRRLNPKNHRTSGKDSSSVGENRKIKNFCEKRETGFLERPPKYTNPKLAAPKTARTTAPLSPNN